MREIKVGDTWEGNNHADMINKVMGTDYKGYMKSTVTLTHFGGDGFAWFVFMDGSVHGTSKDYLWVNKISADGITIVETCISEDKSYVKSVAEKYHKVLAFQLDPDGTGNKYKCKFVGYFDQERYDHQNLIRVYKRISETYSFKI